MGRIETPIKTLPLGAVELTDGYCVNALQKEVSYLLSLQEGRLLAGFYENAGLKTPFVRYGGWESGLIGGHTLGHYLTALSQAYVNAGTSSAEKAKFYEKATRIVDGLAECQANSKGEEGFLWGAPLLRAGCAEAQFDNLERGKTNIVREAWVPWYTMHKILAGLLDAYKLTAYGPALKVASALGDWVYDRASKWSSATLKKVLSVEYGGMNDALYELYGLTGKESHAVAAHFFDEEELFDLVLTEGKDVLNNRHANTTIPKFVGALNRYLTLHGRELGGETIDATRYLRAAESFFKIVVGRHTYVTGGNSEWEHFGADFVLDAERTNCNCETCNTYNMLKLARMLFCVTGDKKYTDYYDNAFTNGILSSQNPETGMTTYFQPMASGFFKVYSTPYDKFWCCTGSGMENFSKLGDSAYFVGGASLYIEQYISSRVVWEKGELEAICNFPFHTKAVFRITRAEGRVTLCFRYPDWAAGEPVATRNGEKVRLVEVRGHLILTAETGDEITLTIPVEVSLQGLPDGKNAFAFRYGNAVLSADLGTEDMEETTTGVSVTIPARRKLTSERVYFKDLFDLFENPSKYLVREGETFRLTGGDMPLTFGVHYKRYRERYTIYLRLCEGEREEEAETRQPFDTVQPGYGQYENDDLHQMEEKNSVSVTADETCRYARAGGYFAYDFALDPAKCNTLSVELRKKDNGKTLKITAGGEKVFETRLLYTLGEEHYRVEIPLNADLLQKVGREKTVDGKKYFVINLRFEGGKGASSARVCEFLYIYAE